MANLKEILKSLYADAFTVNQRADPATVMTRILADDFQSIGSVDTKGRAQLIGQLQFFWRLVPDLKWEVQEMLQDGNRVVVRSIASGTPSGDFMGVSTDGSKTFRIMTIDVHTFDGDQVKCVHHLEDWATAMRQLRG